MLEITKVEGQFFTLTEAIEAITETIENGVDYMEDLHHYAFNEDYYIIGTHEAKKALNEYDVFEAFEIIKEYEQDNFGEITTDFSSPEKVANMLWYIVGEEVVNLFNEKLFEYHKIDSYDLDMNDENDVEIALKVLKSIETI